MKVGYYQFAPEFGEVEKNLSGVLAALDGADADLIVLPELPFTGYMFRDRSELSSLAEEPGSSRIISRLTALCRANDYYLVTGFAEKCGNAVFNSALLLGGEGILQTYRKLHLFNREGEYFDPGDTPLSVIEIRGVKLGLMICFDWVYPEVARVLALGGADLLCHPSNLVLAHCQQAMLTRCTENSVFAVTANRFGSDIREDGSVTFTGRSQIAAPGGELIHRSGPDDEELFVTDIDVSRARNKWMTPGNDLLNDRRPEFYSPLVEK